MIDRWIMPILRNALENMPAVAILGPRQCGKSTLARAFCEQTDSQVVYLDLERSQDMAKLRDPEAFLLANPDALICIDEVQRVPELFSVLRYVIDKHNRTGQFLILGSASRDLIRQSSETLAGRIRYLELTPFLRQELHEHDADLRRYWLRGGFPRSWLAKSDEESYEWRLDFRRDFLERDIPMFSRRIEPATIGRTWDMLAHVHGGLLNMATLASALGVDGHTVRSYIDLLEGAFMVRRLQPVHANLRKRLVKSPKLYFRDVGILHGLLGIHDWNNLMAHPCYGVSWEALCIENILAKVRPDVRAGFYRTARGAEIDLVLEHGDRRAAIEFKASTTPRLQKGFYIALQDLGIEQGYVVAPVDESYHMKNVMVMPLDEIASGDLAPFFR
jgi:predicted AAA+ superfamily ATPase